MMDQRSPVLPAPHWLTWVRTITRVVSDEEEPEFEAYYLLLLIVVTIFRSARLQVTSTDPSAVGKRTMRTPVVSTILIGATRSDVDTARIVSRHCSNDIVLDDEVAFADVAAGTASAETSAATKINLFIIGSYHAYVLCIGASSSPPHFTNAFYSDEEGLGWAHQRFRRCTAEGIPPPVRCLGRL
jgi:hypothetical protein